MNSSAVTDLKVEVKLLHKCLLCIADRLRRFREGSHGSCLVSQAQDSALLDTQGQTKSHVMPAEMVYKGKKTHFCSLLQPGSFKVKRICIYNYSSQL